MYIISQVQSKFSLFQSHLDFAHLLWSHFITPGDWAIDATCGNGHDSCALLRLKVGGLICIDIQEVAIEKTKKNLTSQSSQTEIFYHCGCHSSFPLLSHPIKLIAYNLGYLPGGNKKITTHFETTLQSIQNACSLLTPGGIISITCYPGHPQGLEEKRRLLDELSHLNPMEWNVSHHEWLKNFCPSVLILQKKRD